MDIVLAITTKDAVIVATSKAAVRGISILKVTDDKTRQLSDHSLMAFTGEAGDTVQFAELIQANARLYSMRNGVDLSPTAVSNFTRNELANALRSRKPFQVNVLIAGFDKKTGKPSLNWIDYLAANVSLPYAAHGYASYYTLSLLDRHHKKDISVEQGLELLKACITELQKRIPFDFKGVYVKVVDKDGVRELDEIN